MKCLPTIWGLFPTSFPLFLATSWCFLYNLLIVAACNHSWSLASNPMIAGYQHPGIYYNYIPILTSHNKKGWTKNQCQSSQHIWGWFPLSNSNYLKGPQSWPLLFIKIENSKIIGSANHLNSSRYGFVRNWGILVYPPQKKAMFTGKSWWTMKCLVVFYLVQCDKPM